MNRRDPATSRLRVVVVYFHLELGGIERGLVDLLPRLDPDRFEVHMVCIRRYGMQAPQLARQGIPIHLCRCHSKWPTKLAARTLVRLFRTLKPDIVHAHAARPGQLACVAARRAGVPVVIGNFHTLDVFPTERELAREHRVADARDVAVFVSEAVQQDYLARVRPERVRTAVVYNGVDLERFSAPLDAGRRAELRRELALDGQGPVLLKVARLQRVKAHDDLLAAHARLLEDHPRAVLLLAGDGRRRGEVEASIRERGLESAVRVLGARTDVRDLYHLADVGVLSSKKEGFSYVVLEAMAAGLPQVLTDVGGNREAVGDSGAAELVPPGRPDELARALSAVVGEEGRLVAMGRAASERSIEFGVATQCRRIEALWGGATATGGAGA